MLRGALTLSAEQRTKFVFIRWIGNSVTPMQRAKAVENKNRITEEAIKVQSARKAATGTASARKTATGTASARKAATGTAGSPPLLLLPPDPLGGRGRCLPRIGPAWWPELS